MFLFINVKFKDILDIDKLHIHRHKVTSIVGPSGSGKTTLLRLLNKLNPFYSGDIFYNDQSLKDIPSIALRRNVVMLPQAPPIFEGSIQDNLQIGLKFSEQPLASDQQLMNMLKLVQLNKDMHEGTHNLSGGEKQRLALARVLLMAPEVLLLDEPSSALDEDTEHVIINALVNYTKQNNKTLIMVTHSKKIANQFSDEIIEIKNGSVINQEEG